MHKTFKTKIEGLQDIVVESGAVKHAAQFTKMLENIAKYVQVKYNSDIARMIKDVELAEFNFPEHPVPWVISNEDETSTQEKIDEIDINIWKKDYVMVH